MYHTDDKQGNVLFMSGEGTLRNFIRIDFSFSSGSGQMLRRVRTADAIEQKRGRNIEEILQICRQYSNRGGPQIDIINGLELLKKLAYFIIKIFS